MKEKRSLAKQNRSTRDAFKADHHNFTDSEIASIRSKLLSWYDQNKRSLPWRDLARDSDMNKRSYSVWVSEIMLQQTQVATVIDYYNRWMSKWPRVEDLAKATLEEVNAIWSGLGYYSRAKRLHEGAKKVVQELNGQVPRTAAELMANLPGVGQYTSSAIASIAFNQVTGVVDGNVVRVLSRLRAIGGDSTSKEAVEKYWEISNRIVDNQRPGDFNQALMEFGATLCVPKSPSCEICPLKDFCIAFRQVNEQARATEKLLISGKATAEHQLTTFSDIEDCGLCIPKNAPWKSSLGVENYPRKPPKKQAKDELIAVSIVELNNGLESRFLIVQRPKKGLLAGLWEFPNVTVQNDWSEIRVITELNNFLKEEMVLDLDGISNQKRIGDVKHIFSHIHHNYIIHHCCYSNTATATLTATDRLCRWVTKQDFQDAAVSTAMRKVFTTYEQKVMNSKVSGSDFRESRKRKRDNSDDGMKQASINAFFKPKA